MKQGDFLLQDAFAAAAAAGIPIAAAAGNSASNTMNIPARFKSTISVGACNISYKRWYNPRPGSRFPPSGSNYHRKMNVWAPGQEILGADVITSATCDTCYRRDNGTSAASPHVAGVMAIMVGYEGFWNLDNAHKVYDRLKANYLPFLYLDDTLRDAGAPDSLLQSGVVYHALQPYKGIPDGEQPPWDEGPDKLRRRQDEEEDHGIDTDLDNDDSGGNAALPAPESAACQGVTNDMYISDLDNLNQRITEFCDWAEAEGGPPNGLSRMAQTYNTGTMDAVIFQLEYSSTDADFWPDAALCRDVFNEHLLICDLPNAVFNPADFHGGGFSTEYVSNGTVRYSLSPLVKRQPASGGKSAGCSVLVGDSTRRTVSQVSIWGAGWASADSGAKLDSNLGCGMVGNGNFSYGLGENGREWTLDLIVDGGAGAAGCVSDAIVTAGGPKVECSVAIP